MIRAIAMATAAAIGRGGELERGFLLALQGAAELVGVDAEMVDALGDDDAHVAALALEVAGRLLRWGTIQHETAGTVVRK